MVDIGDLKSPGLNSRAGSSPALGTKIKTPRGVFILVAGLEARLRYFMSGRNKISNWGTEPVRFERRLWKNIVFVRTRTTE
jgi:hypothetical protein